MADPVLKARPGAATVPSSRTVGEPRPPAMGEGEELAPHGVGPVLLRVLLATLSTLVSVNLWTGGPLLALWIGSRIQAAAGQLSMAAVGATLGVLVAETLILYRLLLALNVRYNAVIGRRERRRQAPWLKPVSGERRALEVTRPLTAVERVVIVSVVMAVLALEIWFFFFAHYALPS